MKAKLSIALISLSLASAPVIAQDVPDPNLHRDSAPAPQRQPNANDANSYRNPRVVTPSRVARMERYEYFTFGSNIANQPTEQLSVPAAAELNRNVPGQSGPVPNQYVPRDFDVRDYNYATGHWFDSWYGNSFGK